MESQFFVNNTGNMSLERGLQQLQVYPEALILAYNMYLSLVIALGVPGNLIVLLVFIKMKVATSTDWFIIFNTMLDFISSSFNVPVYLTFTSGAWKYYGSNLICKLHMFLSQVVVISSALITCGLAVERYMKVCRPYAKKMSRKAARNVCVISCLIASLASVPTATMYQNLNGVCMTTTLTAGQFIYYITLFILFITVFIVIPFCYFRICVAVRISKRNVMAHEVSPRPNQSARRIPMVGSNKVHPSTSSSILQENSTSACMGTNVNLDDKDKSVKRNTVNFNNVLERIAPESEHIVSLSAVNNEDVDSAVWTTHDHNDKIQTRASNATVNSYITNHSTNANKVNTNVTHSNNQEAKSSRRNSQTTKIAFMVCSIYIVSWIIPWFCFILLSFVRPPTALRFALIGKMTYLINTISNPILYALYNVKFREGLKTCIDTCKKRRVAR